AVSVPGVSVRGSITGIDAMSHLVSAWAGMNRVGAQTPLMVAFGPDEVEALNGTARAVRRGAAGPEDRPPLASGLGHRERWAPGTGPREIGPREIGPRETGTPETGPRETGPQETGPPELALGARKYAVGDQVLALRRIGPVRSATTGTVTAVGPRSLNVEWHLEDGTRRGEVGADEALSLGYGYATTVPYLRSCDERDQQLLVLGDPLELASRHDRARAAWVPVPGPGLPLSGAAAVPARHRAAVAELATSWPDHDMLERAGPRPLGEIEYRRWAERVVSCALQRALGVGDTGSPGPVRSPASGRSLSPRSWSSAPVLGL
ncbi:MAG TPA: hypothetical protein VEJ84_11955, partial [Acidimicrobiales bacterium]|nr:hypothetical protein [Acidimicrobiales bacterium]